MKFASIENDLLIALAVVTNHHASHTAGQDDPGVTGNAFPLMGTLVLLKAEVWRAKIHLVHKLVFVRFQEKQVLPHSCNKWLLVLPE